MATPRQRRDIRASIARRVGRYRKLTASGGTTDTAVSKTGLFEPDDFWISYWLYCLYDGAGAGAAPEGEMRRVSDYDLSSQTLTVDLAFTIAIASTDLVELYPSYLPIPELNSLMDEALDAASAHWFKPAWDETTLDFSSNTHTYDLPADVMNLRSVFTRTSSSADWIAYRGWRVVGQPGAYKLKTTGQMTTGDMGLHYEARLDWSASPATDLSYLNIVDTPATNLHPFEGWARAYMVEYAVSVIHGKLMLEGDKQRANRHWNLLRMAEKKMGEIAQWNPMPRLAGQVTKPLWAEHSDTMRDRAYTALSPGGTEPGT